jgi:hypothetical protein
MSIKKLAVLSMLVVMLVAFNTPASAQFAGAAGISATSLSSFSASSTSFGSFGGFGFPFNWGFIPFGVGNFPFNWALGGGFGPFPLLNTFGGGFGGLCGGLCGLPASMPMIGANVPLGGLAKGIAKASIDQAVPFILGSPLGGSPLLGLDMTAWAFGTQRCVNNFPLYLGAHGFGFPFTLGNYRIGFTPSCGLPCAPPCLPGCLPGLSGAPLLGGANAPFTMPAANAAIGK